MPDSLDIRREGHFVSQTLEHVALMLDGVRNNATGYTTAVVTMHCAAAENALEAALASVRKAKSEARLIIYQREQDNPLHAYPRAVPARPKSALPAVCSFAAE
jgi:hypothetical protein